MNREKHALLLVGSAKPKQSSTSEALGGYVLQRLEAQGYTTETHFVNRLARGGKATDALLAAIDEASIFILAFPLYVDSPPYLVMKAMEQIAAHRQDQPQRAPVQLVAIANCGFPEAHHNHTALRICRLFAQKADLSWAGGLALCAGQSLNGRPLAEAGGMVRNVRRALDLSADALSRDAPIPQEAVELMAKPLIPKMLYMLLGGVGWRVQARQFGTLGKLWARPFTRARDEER
jgi:hypothetical protein